MPSFGTELSTNIAKVSKENYSSLGQALPLVMVDDMAEYIYYRWRIPALVVAYVHMALGYLCGGATSVGIILFLYVTVQMKRGYLNQETQDLFPGLEPETENLYFGVGLLGTILMALATWGVFHTAICLVKAGTSYGKTHQALKRCGVWRNANLVMLTVSYVSLYRTYDRWYIWLWILFQLVCILVVSMYVRELNQESEKLTVTKKKYNSTASDLAQRRGFEE